MHLKTIVVLALLGSAAILPCQAPGRSYGSFVEGHSSDNFEWNLLMKRNQRVLNWSIVSQPGPFSQLVMPFDLAGNVSSVSPSRAIASGLDSVSKVGFLVDLRFDEGAGSVSIVSQTTFSGIDPSVVIYMDKEEALLVYDTFAGDVYCADFDGVAPLPNQADFSIIASAASIPLPSPHLAVMAVHSDPIEGGVDFFSLFGDPVEDPYWHMTRGVSGAWSVSQRSWDLGPEEARWSILFPLADCRADLMVGGAIGAFEVRDTETGVAVTWGAHSDDGYYLLPTPSGSTPLTPGREYQVVPLGSSVDASPPFVANSRWGQPQQGAKIRMHPGKSTRDIFSGNTDFRIAGSFVVDSGFATLPATLDVFGWVGVNDGVAAVPLPNVSGQDLVLIDEALASLGPIAVAKSGANTASVFSFGLAIPADPSIVGTELVFQFAVVDPTSGPAILVSDVFGAEVQSAPVASASALTQPQATGTSSVSVSPSPLGSRQALSESHARWLVLRARCQR